MNLGCIRRILAAAAIPVICLWGIAPANGQTSPVPKPQMAEDAFKNVKLLKGISVNEFMDTMGFFSASLAFNCTNCHGEDSAGDKARYADETPLKAKARQMIVMVAALNKNNFGGARAVTCYTCHRGDQSPVTRPNLAAQYAVPPPEDPNDVEVRAEIPGGPTADQIFDKYIEALGGVQRLAGLTSIAAKGTYEGYDTDQAKVPAEVFAKAPNQRTVVAHRPRGDGVTAFDGRTAWVAQPDNVVSLMQLTGGDLDGMKTEATLSFPTQIKQIRSQWKVATTSIDGHDVELVVGTSAKQTPIKLYFAKDSGLLVRLVRYTNTMVGQVSSQIDYSDYREVSGVKIPFKWISTWVDGQTTIELSEAQVNVSVEASKFAKPAAPVAPKDQ